MLEAILGFSALLFLIFLKIPLFLSLTIVGLVGFWFVTGSYSASVSMVSQRMIDTTQSYTLAVIPMFIIMGSIISKSGLSESMYRISHKLLYRVPGSHMLTTISTCGILSTLSGSSIATTATIGPMAMKHMRSAGYPDQLSSSSVIAGSTLGIIIPPSVMLVVYGILTENSIRELFIAGLLPGLLGLLLYIITSLILSRSENNTLRRTPPVLKKHDVLWSVCLVALIAVTLGGIIAGVYTPTESSAIGLAGVAVLSLVKGSMTVNDYIECVVNSTKISSSILLVVIGSLIFSNFINVAQFTQEFTSLVSNLHSSTLLTIMFFLLAYLLLGTVIESMSLLLLTVPIFYPIVLSLGVDPIWFGIMIIVMIEISLMTPPIGMNIFTLETVVNDLSLKSVYQGVLPFCLANVIRVVLILSYPNIVLFLPSLI